MQSNVYNLKTQKILLAVVAISGECAILEEADTHVKARVILIYGQIKDPLKSGDSFLDSP